MRLCRGNLLKLDKITVLRGSVMKKTVGAFVLAICAVQGVCFAQEGEAVDSVVQQYLAVQEGGSSDGEAAPSYVKKEKIYPDAKRPAAASQEKLQAVLDTYPDHAEQKYIDDSTDTFKYGLETQIVDALNTMIREEDPRFADAAYDLFLETKVPAVKQKVLEYFTKLEDPCLEDYAVEVINDPYDVKNAVVSACFAYCAAVKSAAAVPGVVDLIDKEDENYFTAALTCLGEVGGEEEGVFVAEYLDREDLTTAQKQALVKVLGKLKAASTYEKLIEIAENEDEDQFCRMYAAEAVGAMQGEGAEEALVALFESEDANLRCYVLKGLSHFSDETANALFIQALRDASYKVRLEALEAITEKKLVDAVPYLIFRCKDKGEEKRVKEKCYNLLSEFNTAEGNEYLISLITDTKTGDTTKGTVAAALLKNGTAGTNEILELASSTLTNDVHKQLRYTLGKEFAKYGRAEFADVCGLFLDSKDVMTQGTGLDIYQKGQYASLTEKVQKIADADGTGAKKNNNAKKAKKILGIEDAGEE